MLSIAGLMHALVLSGCAYVSVQLPQYGVVQQLLPQAEQVDFSSFTWELSWAGRTQPVIAVAVAPLVVFTHENGIEVEFDGWNVTRVKGLLGEEALVLTMDGDRQLRIRQSARLIYAGSCSDWVIEDGAWIQRCDGLSPARISLDAAGNIDALSFTIHPEYPALSLKR